MAVQPGQTATAQDMIKSPHLYAADAGASDAYAISLPVAPSAYADGMTVRFKANTANTGASTLNVNSLGAIAIKRPDTTDTVTGDIVVNQIVEVIYRGGSFYMISPSPTEERFFIGALRNTLVKTYFNVQLLFILWTGAVGGDATTTFANWDRSSTDVLVAPGGGMIRVTGSGAENIFINGPLWVTTGSQLAFSDTNKVVMDWWAKLEATSTGDVSMGFSNDGGDFQQVYNANANGRVQFTMRGSTGVIYATISKISVGVTNVDVSSGITNTVWNNFRIELDLSNNALFYINGDLKATLSGANLPSTGVIHVGFGRSNTAAFLATAPNLSLEMNP